MKISIVPADGLLSVDGVFRAVDLSDIDQTIHALQFDSDAQRGRVWFKAETDKGQADVTDVAPYQVFIDRWVAAEPPPPVPQPLRPKQETVTDLKAALIAKGILTQADLD